MLVCVGCLKFRVLNTGADVHARTEFRVCAALSLSEFDVVEDVEVGRISFLSSNDQQVAPETFAKRAAHMVSMHRESDDSGNEDSGMTSSKDMDYSAEAVPSVRCKCMM
jgi:hypothetical protein